MDKKAHAAKKDLPATEISGLMETRSTEWEGYQVSFSTIKKIHLACLKVCRITCVTHRTGGYLFKGKMVLKYRGREEAINAGEAF